MTVYKNKPLALLRTTPEARCVGRVNARSTHSRHSSDPADAMPRGRAVEIREAKAIELADRGRAVRNGREWFVFSLSSAERYNVRLDPIYCSCGDFELRHEECKHIMAARLTLSREGRGFRTKKHPTTPPVVWPRPTYGQDWPNYDLAQQNEKPEFQRLLADLCGTIPQPAPKSAKGGRPTALLSDLIFATVFKIYSTVSGRRFTADLRDARERGYIAQAVHHSTIARCLEDKETTPILIGLIEASAAPFKAIETEFAVDSSGFSAGRFDRWYEEKWGRWRSEHCWVKIHIVTGTTTQVVASVIAAEKDSPDAPQFKPLVQAAAKTFTIDQMSGDKAYASAENFQAVEDAGGTGYLAFKTSATGGVGGVYERMFHLFSLNKEDYLHHYHRRSNIESVFSSVKRLFGDFVRSKGDVAMKNEALAKLLAYNITLLVHAIYELNLEPRFGADDDADYPVILPLARPG